MDKIKKIYANGRQVDVKWGENVADVDYNNAVSMAAVISRGAYIKEKKEFAFVIYGDYYQFQYRSGETPDFVIDWGDGTQSTVKSFSDWQQNEHYYPSAGEWTIRVFNYKSGHFYFNGQTSLLRVLTPYPKSETLTHFPYWFASCYNLTFICDDFLINNPHVEIFDGMFSYCRSLPYISEKFFSYNPEATSFNNTFYNCENIVLHENMFIDNTKVTDYSYCFANGKNVTGVAPGLWEKTNPVPTGTQCFRDCINLSNYDDIPSNWK